MMKFITAAILISISVTVFFLFTDPFYKDITNLRTQVASYNEALGKSQEYENQRQSLTAKYSTISADNLAKLSRLLPDSIDNIRLILEIGQIAQPYGMVLKDVKYDTTKDAKPTNTPGAVGATPTTVDAQAKDYGVWELKFSTTGTYNNFLNFTRDLESNLRIVDISSIDFTSTDSVNKFGSSLGASTDVYKYDFGIKTYWLKN